MKLKRYPVYSIGYRFRIKSGMTINGLFTGLSTLIDAAFYIEPLPGRRCFNPPALVGISGNPDNAVFIEVF